MPNNYHHGDLSRVLRSAAAEALRRAPPSDISLRALARQVGVSAAAPYRHFPDRESLLDAVASDGYKSAATKLSSRTSEGASAVAEVWSTIAEENPGLIEVMTRPEAGNRHSSELSDSVMEWLGQVVRAIETEEGRDDPAQLVKRAVSCWAAIHGLVWLNQSGVLNSVDSWMLPDPVEMANRTAGS
jgi:AcrR family transcriptional regulator